MRVLEDADGIAVARLDEGLALRAAGFSNRTAAPGRFDADELAAAADANLDLMVRSRNS